MSRVTKKELQRRLDEAISFQKKIICALYAEQAYSLREIARFIPVEQYPPWCVPQDNEIGMLTNTRYLLEEDECSQS